MKIKNIKLNNYRAFYGEYNINVSNTIEEWFENRNCYNTNNESPCDFLNQQTIVSEINIDTDEIPF